MRQLPPIFVGGINRSGTSMVRQILGSHPDLAMPPTEFEFFKRLRLRPRARLSAEQAAQLVDSVLGWPKLASWGVDPELVRARVAREARHARDVFVAFLAEYARKLGKPRWGDKTTSSELYLRMFDRWFAGEFGFVHVVRHPVAAYASGRWYEGLERRIDPVMWAHVWNESVHVALRETHRRRRGYVAIRYEDVVAAPEQVTRRICDVVGLAYAERMLAMADFEQKSNSSFGLAAPASDRPIRATDDLVRAAWLDAAELAVVRKRCRLAAALVGYDVDDEKAVLPLRSPVGAYRVWTLGAMLAAESTRRVARRSRSQAAQNPPGASSGTRA